MDLSKFKVSDWLIVGGALGFLIFGTFLKWFRVSIEGFGDTGGNAFDFFLTGTVPWLLIVATGVVAFLLAGGVIKASQAPWPIIFVAATGLGTLLLFIRFLVPTLGEDIPDGLDVSRSAGIWLTLISAIVALAGSVMKFTESGIQLSDLTDADKRRDAFDRPARGTGTPPPPPPAGGPPPPPPPGGGTPPPPPPPG